MEVSKGRVPGGGERGEHVNMEPVWGRSRGRKSEGKRILREGKEIMYGRKFMKREKKGNIERGTIHSGRKEEEVAKRKRLVIKRKGEGNKSLGKGRERQDKGEGH